MSIEEARAAFTRCCVADMLDGGIHAVTFQPTPDRENEDRYVVEEWDDVDQGPSWLFLAVLDGHAGSEAAEYTKDNLPSVLRNALRSKLASSQARYNHAEISALLRLQIEEFDRQIGAAVIALCPDPHELDHSSASSLLDSPDSCSLRRAISGTTLSIALIDGKKENLWVIGLGDSSVVLLTNERRLALTAQRLTPLHNTSTPSEYARVKLAHPTSEYNVLKDQRVLGVLSITRAIGDFSYKLPAAYSVNLFSKMHAARGGCLVQDISKYNTSPPYIIATSDVRHIDLTTVRDKEPILLLYTDGVNNIIEGRFLFRKGNPSKTDPAAVLGALLSDPVDKAFLEGVFDHAVEPRWNKDGNRAVEILGNILGGRDAVRMEQIMTPALLSTTGESDLYVDDTTIIFCPLTL
ncbi:hypothetical protein C0992_004719 [Termitomyces sp. T32_za158]|nr:hypothetical protein C0992_004719 [Termitomyces sp. T32_za158]